MNMLMLKQKNKKTNLKFIMAALAATGLLVGVSTYSGLVRADQFDDQIRNLQQQNSATQQVVNDLSAQANSYQDAIDKLQSQIDSLQQNIADNQQKSADLQTQIDANQAKLDHEKEILSENIRTMYLEGDISTLEILASSKDLSDFVNKQEYRNTISDKLKSTMDAIAILKARLQAQRTEVENLIKSLESQKQELASTQAQQASMLAYTEGQKAAYTQQIQGNQSKIADLRRQQAASIARYSLGTLAGDPNHGGYPSVWNNAAKDSMIDYWGMYNRECVSYTAFKVHQDFLAGKNSHDMPYWGGIGNANMWDDNARAMGIPVDYTPTPGSIAISNGGTWGHAMYVEAVAGDKIYVSQYNAGWNSYTNDFDGLYSEAWRYTTGLVFIHF